jgi:membrane protein implicated in regulation of membrane protease activity
MLTQIRDISGIDGSTLQNWTKRGWVANSRLKKYNINQIAHILIINMLRSCMQLDRIAFLIQYINGRVDDRRDDIIADSILYDYICKILDMLVTYDECTLGSIRDAIVSVTSDYEETVEGALERLVNALEIIIVAYYATLVKKHADDKLEELYNQKAPKMKGNRKTDTDLIIGRRVKVIEPINNREETGTVKINGQEWSARLSGKDDFAASGETVTIQSINGVKLICKKI